MGVRRYQDLIAWQMADAFKREVHRLVAHSAAARSDRYYCSQLLAASESVAANIAEGFLRDSPGGFRRFLGVGLGSLGEAENRLRDGIARGYFAPADCAAAFRLARRCAVASARLRTSQLAFMKPGPGHRSRP